MKALRPLADVRQMYVVDALRYSLVMESRAYKEMWGALRRIERCKATHPPDTVSLRALAAAWETVDMTHRVIGLAGQVRGLTHKSLEYRSFVGSTKSIVKFRNQFQHLNSHIPKLVGKSNPVMGTLSWVSKSSKSNYTISFGGGNQDTNYHTIPFTPDDWSFACTFQLTAGNNDLDLTRSHSACIAFSDHLGRWLTESNMLQRIRQKVGVIRVHLNRRPPS